MELLGKSLENRFEELKIYFLLKQYTNIKYDTKSFNNNKLL